MYRRLLWIKNILSLFKILTTLDKRLIKKPIKIYSIKFSVNKVIDIFNFYTSRGLLKNVNKGFISLFFPKQIANWKAFYHLDGPQNLDTFCSSPKILKFEIR